MDQDVFLLSDRGGTKNHDLGSVTVSMNKGYLDDLEDEEEKDENGDVKEEDIVTPYSICNKTSMKLHV